MVAYQLCDGETASTADDAHQLSASVAELGLLSRSIMSVGMTPIWMAME
jgi:hypothetical protein